MLFENVSILGLAHVDAPHRVSSAEIEDRLAPAFARFGMRPDILRTIAGIEARRFWDEGTMPSDAATLAAEKVLAETGLDRGRVGVLVNTSVCRDYVEPSTACIVHGNLGLRPHCRNFDLGNACLAFIDGMELVAALIERGEIDYGLIVDGEGSRYVIEQTIARMLSDEATPELLRAQFATLTLGSGAVAMVLARSDLAPEGHRFRGGVCLAASEHARLCRGQNEFMETDTRALLMAGVELAHRTWQRAHEVLGWTAEALDEMVLHQVSLVHTNTLAQRLGFDVAKCHLIFSELGNIGPAAVPITLSKAVELGRVKRGDRVALMAIGSGLNCAMAEVVW